MAYPQGTYTIGSPGPTPRPAVVTWAGILLYVVAGLLVVTAVTVFAEMNAVVDGIRQVYASDSSISATDLDNAMSIAKTILAVIAVFFIVIAVLYVILAIFDLKGRNGMRITTWVIAGIGVLCFGLGTTGRTGGGEAQTQINGRTVTVHVDIPSAISAISTVANILGVLCLIAVIILLALPASNDFFRRSKGIVIVPGMDPGYPQYAAPGYPQPGYPQTGYPQNPGYPQDPGYPPGQPPTDPGYPPTQPPTDPNAR